MAGLVRGWIIEIKFEVWQSGIPGRWLGMNGGLMMRNICGKDFLYCIYIFAYSGTHQLPVNMVIWLELVVESAMALMSCTCI